MASPAERALLAFTALDRRGWLTGYVAAVVLVAIATVTTLAFAGIGGRAPFLFDFLAVVVPALIGGIGPGILAVALVTVANGVMLPLGSPAGLETADLADMAVFAAEGMAIVALVAALRTARERLERANVQLRESDRLKDLFLSTATHELRNPLTTMRLQLDLMRHAREPMSPTQARAVERFERGVDRLARLSDDLHDMGRLQRGRFEVVQEPVDLAAVVSEAVEPMEPVARAAGLALELHAASSLWVRGDAQRLAQVLTNLVGNAIKFTPAGGRITVSAAAVNGEAVVRVEDTGRGLAPEQLEGLFQPFAQAEREHAARGTGLGLYISHGIVAQHGGRIGAASDGPGRGATFTFTVPLSSTAAPAPPRAEEVGARAP
jgi:signal transduction histidine kinase